MGIGVSHRLKVSSPAGAWTSFSGEYSIYIVGKGIRRWLLLARKVMTSLDSVLKHKDITFPTKVHIVKALVVMQFWELDHKKGRAPKNWCFWTVVLEKTVESSWTGRRSNQSILKGNQPWILIGWTDAEAPIFWPPDAKSWLTGKDPDAGKDWKQKRSMTEDEMVG